MALDIGLLVVCGYFIFQNVQALLAVPFAAWGLSQVLLAVVTLLLFAVMVYMAIRIVKQWRKKSGEAAGAEEKPQPGAAEDEPPASTAETGEDPGEPPDDAEEDPEEPDTDAEEEDDGPNENAATPQ